MGHEGVQMIIMHAVTYHLTGCFLAICCLRECPRHFIFRMNTRYVEPGKLHYLELMWNINIPVMVQNMNMRLQSFKFGGWH